MMMQSLLKIDKDKLENLDCQRLTAFERDSLSDLCSILHPFQQATLHFQQESTPSASYVLPSIRAIKSKLRSMKSRMHGKLVSALLASLEKRFQECEGDIAFVAAAVLDPKFRYVNFDITKTNSSENTCHMCNSNFKM